MVLPDMSGRELAEVLAGETPGIKVLYASGYAAPILAARASPVAASSILEKPFPASDLLRKVRAALG
jgi:CheY-like chemotaxis protein